MRFDDTLETVLAGDLASPQGMQSAWRQVVDLIGRRRAQPDTRAMATLRSIRPKIPAAVRAASARALEYADPPAPLVRLFALDDLPIALPVLRSARISSAEWIQLLPDLAPAARAVLRNRRDLSPLVKRALEAYGPIDFVLPDQSEKVEEAAAPIEAVAAEPLVEAIPVAAVEPEPEQPEPVLSIDWVEVIEARPPSPAAAPAAPKPMPSLGELLERLPSPVEIAPAEREAIEVPEIAAAVPEPATAAESTPDSFAEDLSWIALAEIGPLPAEPDERQSEVVSTPVQSGTSEPQAAAEAIALADEPSQGPTMDQGEAIVTEPAEPVQAADSLEQAGPFEIADVVARIDAFWRDREGSGAPKASPPAPATQFRFETDAKGVFRWVEGVSRSAMIGLTLELQGGPSSGAPEGSRIDAGAAGAFRRRAGFSNARLWVEGDSDAAGDWLISAIPVFDSANGRFTGYRGTGRRPRADERAEPVRAVAPLPADSLRQLVHELRTPTNAIAGFAEMIETQMLGPVADPYRDRAHDIRVQARELLGAIDDLDLAARIDSAALSLVPGTVALRPLLGGIADDLADLAALRGSAISLPVDDLAVSGDRRAVERLLARLLATLVSASREGERIGVGLGLDAGDTVTITIDRPQALQDYPGDTVLGIDDEREDSTLLGTGFALRLARNLARELGGALTIGSQSLTLRLPASVNSQVSQAHLS